MGPFLFSKKHYMVICRTKGIRSVLIDSWLIKQRVRLADAVNMTPRKYVFDVTSVGQRSSPWPAMQLGEISSVKCKFCFLVGLMLRQMHWPYLSVSVEAKS